MMNTFTRFLMEIRSIGHSKFFKHKLKYVLSVTIFLFISVGLQGQSKVVTGLVTDERGEVLPGVSVLIKGTQNSTTTSSEGKFSIRVPDNNSVIVFSYIGFAKEEINVGGQSNLTVSLKENASFLNEVVVVGYGAARKSDLTGSVGVVKMEDINKAPVTSVDQALAGRIAGVQVTSPDGQPGAVSDIVIRGTGSITQSSSPLYVVDGFPQEENAFNTLNPNDIESLTVLKDASSTAIYGARGANGVVVITTKRGQSGAPKFNFNAYYGTQEVLKKMDLMNAYDFVRLQNDISPGFGRAIYFTNGRTLESYRNVETLDWQDKVFQLAPFANYNMSLSGKAANTNYYISGNYVDQKGLIVESGFRRYQGRITLDQQLGSKFKTGIVANYSATKSYGNQPSTQSQGISGTPGTQNSPSFNLMQNIWSYRPVNSSGDLDALANSFEDSEAGDRDLDRLNPYLLAINTVNDNYSNSLLSNAYIEYEFIKDFKLKSTLGINYGSGRREFFNNTFTRGGSPLTSQGQNNGMNGGINSSTGFSLLNENTLTYDKKINNDHTVNALVGFTNQRNTTNTTAFTAIQVPNEQLGVSGLDEGTPLSLASAKGENTLASFLGRVNYNYKSRYFLTASMRADGSSKFYTGKKWGYFPSAAFKWRILQEPFMKNLRGSKVLSSADLRLSYGVTGNNRVSDYAYTSPIQLSGSGTGTRYSFNNQIITGAVPTRMFNPGLRWETSSVLDIGFEAGLFNSRINMEMDYYKKKTFDLLLQANIPSSLGFNSTTENIGDIQNEGLELGINSTNIRSRNFSWSTSFNISFNKNKVLALARNQEVREEFSASSTFGTDFQNQPLYIAKIGQPVASFFGYVYDGLYRLADFDAIQNGTTTTYRLKPNIAFFNNATTPQPGDVKFKDLDGDGVINSNDFAVIGTPYPKHYGGITNNFTYKGFDMSVFMHWSYGNEVYNGNRTVLEGQSTGDTRGLGINMLASYADYWTSSNDDATQPRALVNAFGQRAFSSRFIEDASFLRLKTVSLGYALPKNMLSRIKVSNARVYVSAQNLKTWTNYTGPDPEVSTKNSPTTPGFDFSPYPRTRVIVLGTNVTF